MIDFKPLTLEDRCERCSAAAYVRVHKSRLPLDFCSHHFAEFWADLMTQGFEVFEDIRDRLKVPA